VLTRSGGTLGEAGSVAGNSSGRPIFCAGTEKDMEKIFERVGSRADDVNYDDGTIEIIGPVEHFKTILDALRSGKFSMDEAELRMLPTNEMDLSTEDTLQVLKSIESLEDLDDVQNVFHNLHISEEALASLAEE